MATMLFNPNHPESVVIILDVTWAAILICRTRAWPDPEKYTLGMVLALIQEDCLCNELGF